MRRRTLGNLRTRLNSFERLAVRPACKGTARRIDLERNKAKGAGVEWLHSVLASYGGHLRHGLSLRAWEKMWSRYPWLMGLFERRGWTLDERWSRHRIARARRFQWQYWSLVHHASHDCLIFFQMGRFIEFYGPQRVVATRALGLHTVRLSRAGYAFTAGFPKRLCRIYMSRAIKQGLTVVDVRQVSSTLNGKPRLRLPFALLMPKLAAVRSYHVT